MRSRLAISLLSQPNPQRYAVALTPGRDGSPVHDNATDRGRNSRTGKESCIGYAGVPPPRAAPTALAARARDAAGSDSARAGDVPGPGRPPASGRSRRQTGNRSHTRCRPSRSCTSAKVWAADSPATTPGPEIPTERRIAAPSPQAPIGLACRNASCSSMATLGSTSSERAPPAAVLASAAGGVAASGEAMAATSTASNSTDRAVRNERCTGKEIPEAPGECPPGEPSPSDPPRGAITNGVMLAS